MVSHEDDEHHGQGDSGGGGMRKKPSAVNFANDVSNPPSRLRSIGSALFDLPRSRRPSYSELAVAEPGQEDPRPIGEQAGHNSTGSINSRSSYGLRRVSSSRASHLENLSAVGLQLSESSPHLLLDDDAIIDLEHAAAAEGGGHYHDAAGMPRSGSRATLPYSRSRATIGLLSEDGKDEEEGGSAGDDEGEEEDDGEGEGSEGGRGFAFGKAYHSRAGRACRILLIASVAVCVAVVSLWVSLAPHRPTHHPRSSSPTSTPAKDLFVDMLGVREVDVQDKIKRGWDQVFYGDAMAEACYFQVAGDMALMLNTEGPFVTSEGMSYGMMIATQLGQREELDRLWRWTKAHMRQGDGEYRGLLAWKVAVNGTVLHGLPAPDAEAYVITALLIAHYKWGSRGGGQHHDYLGDARLLLDRVSGQHRDDGLFDRKGRVYFAPSLWGRNHSNPSYHLPAFFEMWARVHDREGWPEAEYWYKAARQSRDYLRRAVHPVAGLAPDYTDLDGRPAPDINGHGNFQYDAWRVGANIAMDWAWWGKDEWQRDHADELQQFFMTRGIKSYDAIYMISGKQVANRTGVDHSTGLIAMNAVPSIAARHRGTAGAFVEELWELDPPTGKFRYYGCMLYLMALLHVSGRFRPAHGL